MSEERYERRVLLAVTGMSHQIVTETLWALMMEQDSVPTEVRVVTTERGRNLLVRNLLEGPEARFKAFCDEYGLAGRIRFEPDDIIVIRDAEGRPLDDIRTPEENRFAADMIVREVEAVCRDPKAQLHVSIAGGRKSMGFFAGYAMSLFGRAQDSVSHVLVSEAFESNRDFYYPPKEPQIIVAPDGSKLDTSEARVMLAEIPVVRLRAGLPEALLEGVSTFSDAVREAQQRISPILTMRVNLRKRRIWCGEKEVRLTPITFVVMAWMAKRSMEGLPAVRPGLAEVKDMLRLYGKAFPESPANFERASSALKRDEDVLPYVQEKRSLIHSALKKALGKGAEPYLIAAQGVKPQTAYGLTLPPSAIEWVE